MSRSCHRAMFSNAVCALARTTRASPEICSDVMGLRLCGIADDPSVSRRRTLRPHGPPCAGGADFGGDLV